MRTYVVALCGLSARDQRLLEIVINRPAFAKHAFKASDVLYAQQPEIAIFDRNSEASCNAFGHLLAQHPGVVGVAIQDGEGKGDGSVRHVLARQALLVSIFGVLTTIVEQDLAGAPAQARPVAAPAAAPVPPPVSNITPLATAQRDPVPTPPSPPPASDAFVDGRAGIPERLHALIVDDSLAVREQLKAGLERMGFVCQTADSAEAAQISLGSNTYNLALLDVVMPGMDGYDLCRVIKRDRYLRKMPVVMLTSRSSPFDRARGALSGCDAYLTKPVSWAQFVAAVEKVMLHWAQNDKAKLKELGYVSG